MNMFSLADVQNFEKYSELAAVGMVNIICHIREVIWSVPWHTEIIQNKTHP
jgi:hypothetical protein